MKWLFIIFLLANIFYFGWELDRQTRIEVSNSVRPFDVPAEVQKLALLSEIDKASHLSIPPLKTNEDKTANGMEVENEIFDVEDSALQNIASMMEQGNVMIEKKLIDELTASSSEIAINLSGGIEPAKTLCVSFGPFAEIQQAGELGDWLKSNGIQTNQRSEGDGKDSYFWIYLSPLDSKDEAMAAIEDLKGKGVKDYKVINNGNLENAISLGLFSSQTAVNRRLNELKNIGYQPIIVPYHKNQSMVWVDAKVDVKKNMQEDIFYEFFNGYPSQFNSLPVNCDEIFPL